MQKNEKYIFDFKFKNELFSFVISVKGFLWISYYSNNDEKDDIKSTTGGEEV